MDGETCCKAALFSFNYEALTVIVDGDNVVKLLFSQSIAKLLQSLWMERHVVKLLFSQSIAKL